MKAKEINPASKTKVRSISDEKREELGLLMMIKEVNRTEKVTREEIMKILANK